MYKITTEEDVNVVTKLTATYTINSHYTEILNSNVAKEIVQPFVKEQIKEIKDIDVEYINKNINSLEDLYNVFEIIKDEIINKPVNNNEFINISIDKKIID